ncbi:MAG: hypothetical protein ACTTJS_04060 [Wolinella sp.]
MKPILSTLASEVAKAAHDSAPIKSLELRASIGILSVSDSQAVVGHKFNDKITVNSKGDKTIYPLFVHEGTSAYEMVPKSKKALSFEGAKHPLKHVKHPGIKANPYFESALSSVRVKRALKQDELNAKNRSVIGQ